MTLNHDNEESCFHWRVTLAINVKFLSLFLLLSPGRSSSFVFGLFLPLPCELRYFSQTKRNTHESLSVVQSTQHLRASAWEGRVEIFSTSFPICSQFSAAKKAFGPHEKRCKRNLALFLYNGCKIDLETSLGKSGRCCALVPFLLWNCDLVSAKQKFSVRFKDSVE